MGGGGHPLAGTTNHTRSLFRWLPSKVGLLFNRMEEDLSRLGA